MAKTNPWRDSPYLSEAVRKLAASPKFERFVTPTQRNLIQIEGDWYAVTVPLYGIWLDIQNNQHMFPDMVDRGIFESYHLVIDLPSCKEELYWRAYLNDRHSSIAFNFTPQKMNFRNHVVSVEGGYSLSIEGPSNMEYRPMLIPLNKDKQFDPAILSANPNGTILRGGSLQYGDQIFDFEKAIPDYRKGEKPQITDTIQGIKPLEWICWDGFLYGTRNLCHIPYMDLHELGLLAG